MKVYHVKPNRRPDYYTLDKEIADDAKADGDYVETTEQEPVAGVNVSVDGCDPNYRYADCPACDMPFCPVSFCPGETLTVCSKCGQPLTISAAELVSEDAVALATFLNFA